MIDHTISNSDTCICGLAGCSSPQKPSPVVAGPPVATLARRRSTQYHSSQCFAGSALPRRRNARSSNGEAADDVFREPNSTRQLFKSCDSRPSVLRIPFVRELSLPTYDKSKRRHPRRCDQIWLSLVCDTGALFLSIRETIPPPSSQNLIGWRPILSSSNAVLLNFPSSSVPVSRTQTSSSTVTNGCFEFDGVTC